MNGPLARPGIAEIAPYVGGEARLAGHDSVIKLASNEGALGPSPKAMAALKSLAREVHRYPDGASGELRAALARLHGIDAERIVCGAGSDELISLLCRAYAGPGDEVLHTEHGFLMYAIAARTVGATPVAAPERRLTADPDALLERVSERTRILFLANPNNPTGTYLSAVALRDLRKRLPERVLLVIDAAYAEFVGANDYSSGVEMVETGDNVVMTRTFSKIYGLGGLRLGWAYCPAGIADVLNRVRNPFNVAAPAQVAGLAALADVAFTDKARRHNAEWLKWTTRRLRALGLEVPDSAGNFVLARFAGEPGRDAAAADEFLRRRGIIVRRMGGYGLPHSLRITIGRAGEMRALASALADFLDRT